MCSFYSLLDLILLIWLITILLNTVPGSDLMDASEVIDKGVVVSQEARYLKNEKSNYDDTFTDCVG